MYYILYITMKRSEVFINWWGDGTHQLIFVFLCQSSQCAVEIEDAKFGA